MNYAAAEITFIERESNKENRAYMYPITKVILRERDNPNCCRIFNVTKNGKWQEDIKVHDVDEFYKAKGE